MPTQLQAPGKSGVVSKRDQELKPRRDMLADMNLPQRPQVFDGACEISRSDPHPRDSSPELEGRHGKQTVLDLLFWRVYSAMK